MITEIQTTAPCGVVRGLCSPTVTAWYGIPYAEAPTGQRRFSAAVPKGPSSEPIDATASGPICPQLPSRLSQLMGAFEAEQDEDCLSLNVWAPAGAPQSLPVLVFLHGGGYSSGAGSLPWYDGARLAVAQQAVVITINYRLGALGFLFHPALDANVGLSDQIAALRFVKDNISSFGGDRERITLIGQSAGAHSIACLLAAPDTAHLVDRAVLLSTPFGMGLITEQQAAERTDTFLGALGLSASDATLPARLRKIPVASLLSAQGKVMMAHGKPGDPTPPFGPVATGRLSEAGALDAALIAGSSGVDLIIGVNRDELNAFYPFDSRLAELSPEGLATLGQSLFGVEAEWRLAAAGRDLPGATPLALLSHAQNHHYFFDPALRVAGARAPGTSWVYRFDWASPDPRIGASHCIELPFLFGNFAAFADGPMVGEPTAAMQDLSTRFSDAIGSFATGWRLGAGAPWRSFVNEGDIERFR